MTDIVFRFDADTHEYLEPRTGEVFPHITGMLLQTGKIDDTWYTEEGTERGKQCHRLTADYDYGALHVPSCVSRYRGYLLGHVAAMNIVRPHFDMIEEPEVHPIYRFGGRPDRVGRLYNLVAVLEGKSGGPDKSHTIQTALQAFLVAHRYNLPPQQVARFCLYWKDNGKFKLEEHTNKRDFDEAWRIIRHCCRL